jgi:histidine triad (HIT) family protein
VADDCPFCALVAGRETARNHPADIVLSDESTTAFVSPRWWEACPGHVLVVPNAHRPTLDEMEADLLGRVYGCAGDVATALERVDRCEGVSTRQHNGPGAGQEIWHFHVHVFPRWGGDRLYERNGETRWVSAVERAERAARLREALVC